MAPRAVVVPSEGSLLRVAGLTLLERSIVKLSRAGAEAIAVVAERPLPEFRRLPALEIRVETIEAVPAVGEFVLADAALFASPEDVARVLVARGRLTDRGGRPLPLEARRADGAPVSAVAASAPAFVVRTEADREHAARLLWASLGTSADGLVDRYLNRPAGRMLSKLLVATAVTPNQVTLLGTAVGLIAAFLIAQPDPVIALAGTLLFQIAAAIDCVDGDLARVRFQESPFGKWLDLGLDQLVHVAIFAAIAVHCARRGVDLPAAALGVSAVAGALVSFAVVVRGMRLPPESRNPRLSRMVDRMTNRDFSIALIALALAGRLDWFLWLAATVSHLFWMVALLAQLVPGRGARALES